MFECCGFQKLNKAFDDLNYMKCNVFKLWYDRRDFDFCFISLSE